MSRSSRKAAPEVPAKERADWNVTASEAVTNLEQALVQARLLTSVNRNVPTRETLALARAHATAALGGIAELQGRVRHEPR